MPAQPQPAHPSDRLLHLASRCEEATGPDAAIDAEILWNTAPSRFKSLYWQAATGLPRDLHKMPTDGLGWFNVCQHSPRYTTSLDAAMTLVPEGVSFAVGKGIETELGDSATDYAWCGSKTDPHEGPYCWAATPSLALCAAALRARSQEESR